MCGRGIGSGGVDGNAACGRRHSDVFPKHAGKHWNVFGPSAFYSRQRCHQGSHHSHRRYARTVTFTPGSGQTTIGAPVAINVNGSYVASGTDPLAPSNPCQSAATPANTHCAPGGTNNLGTFTTETGAGTPASITITLTAAGSTTWASAADVLTPTTGAAGIYGHGFQAFAEHGLGSTSGQYAGFYSIPGPIVGAGLPGLIAAAAGLVALARRRRANALA